MNKVIQMTMSPEGGLLASGNSRRDRFGPDPSAVLNREKEIGSWENGNFTRGLMESSFARKYYQLGGITKE
jgi:hypothetical protein